MNNPTKSTRGGARPGGGRKRTIAPTEPTVGVFLRLPASLADSLKARASAQGIKFTDLARKILAQAEIAERII